MQPTLPRRFVLATLLLTGTTAAFLAAAEAALRLTLGPELAAIYAIDERYLHRLVPGSAKRVRRLPVNGGDVVEVRVNRAGLLGAELAPAGARTRIVVYGDSFIAAEFSTPERAFTGQLGAMLERHNVAAQVLNAGVPAYGPDQVSLRLEDELPALKPELVIVALYAGNDFGELLRNKIYKLDPEGRAARHDFRIHPRLRTRFERPRRQLVLSKLVEKALYRWTAGDNPSGDVLDGPRRAALQPGAPPFQRVESWLLERRKEYRRYVVDGDSQVTNLLGDTYDADVSTEPDGESARYKVALMDRVVTRIAAICAERGAGLMLLLIPSPIDVAEDYAYAQVDRARHPRYRRAANTDALERIARGRGIPYVNLFEPFRSGGGAALFFRGGDDHWNDAGQRLAAETVADYLVGRGMI